MARKLNEVIVEGGVGRLLLKSKHGCVICEALISDCDAERVRNFPFCWRKHERPHTTYVAATFCENGRKGRRSTVFLHRFIMNEPSGLQIDHKNRNGLDCRRDNLRVTTQGQNNQNQRIEGRRSRSGVRNVHWNSDQRIYTVRLRLSDGKQHSFGRFKDVQEAAKVASDVRKRLHSHSPENSVEMTR